MTTNGASLTAPLEAYLSRALPDRPDIALRNLAVISAGWESDVYAFDLEWGPCNARHCEALVLRAYVGAHADAKSEREFRGIQQLRAAGYPVPRVLLLERDAAPLGRPFISATG